MFKFIGKVFKWSIILIIVMTLAAFGMYALIIVGIGYGVYRVRKHYKEQAEQPIIEEEVE